MNAIILVINIVMILSSIILIAVILMQDSKGDGMGALTGGGTTESFFGKNKSSSREGRLQKWTKIFMAVIAVLCVAMVILSRYA